MKFFAILGALFLQLVISEETVQLAPPTLSVNADTEPNDNTDKFAPLRQALALKGAGANGK